MLKIQNKEVSPDLKAERHERDALLGEKNNLQAEMLSLGEVNKRVKKEIEDLEVKRELTEKQFDTLREAIEGHVALKKSVEQEIKNLDKVYNDKKLELEKTLPDVEKILFDLECKKAPIQSEIDSLIVSQNYAEKSLKKINKEISDNEVILSELISNIAFQVKQEKIINTSIEKKKSELKDLEEMVSKNSAIIEGIEKRGILLSNINKDIEEAENKFILRRGEIRKFLEVESDDLKKELEKNKAINEQEKALHISLMSKKQILDNKEAFIKGQYIRAGLKYEEN